MTCFTGKGRPAPYLEAMASNLLAMAFNLITVIAMASNLEAMAHIWL